ncbi:serine-aspartate repeat adhesin O-glycosyltransferase SdgB [Staphylococcus simiae]|uniref:Glycosyl transferase, group 1 family protein n=1 Tax=Staphylococcus simiae CCM 7213 = CCUG 51256 TaxID=911238 RepID=G5JJ04_9STAP|nr:glycosyltransferase [Staphylococcus simiae]EHJ07826.1 glycosyl transferase, group 1 family protein [Staphylococcus simiae CCM 7213 = CCUG 51256]PNZ10237.1 glycosyl transferase family 1 [Staphylococcus simiae]SNV62250.1 putative glycosyltransferase [Staphylococcus simiae]
MYYFVVNNLGKSITGIEKAVINRLSLFKEINQPAKCIFLAWNRFQARHASKFLKSDEYINMYDYLQEAHYISNVVTTNWIKYWQEECHYTLKFVDNSNDVRIYDKDTFIMYVHFLDSGLQVLDYINHFDSHRKKIRRDFYDVRGFLSCSRFLENSQTTLCEFYYSPHGNIKLEKYFTQHEDKQQLKKIIYHNGNDDYFFNNDTELGAYFIEQLYHKGDVFFSDKNLYTAPIFNLTDRRIPVVGVLHSTHIKNIEQLETSRYKNVYKALFDNLDRYAAIVVSTKAQKVDVTNRIQHDIPVINIPVGYSEAVDFDFNQPSLDPIKLISVARYSPEKQLHQQIELIKKLKSFYPNIQLHMYGFGSEHDKLKSLIAEYNLEQNILLRGFLPNLENEYRQAYASLITSNMEGFSLALLESLSHGVPTISYDIKYGPSELIDDHINGVLVPKNDEEQLFSSVKYLLDNPSLQRYYSEESLIKASTYSKDLICNTWDNFLRMLPSK